MQNLLIYGDAPDSHSGLGRIARDLALISSSLPDFRVGTYGRSALCSSRLPFPQYSFPDSAQWGEHSIRKVWQDFTRSTSLGSIMTVWDASRLLWFAGLASMGDNDLDVFLGSNRTYQKWGYFMVDGTGPDGRTLPVESAAVMKAYDRVVISSLWGAEVVRASGVECEWIPHPIDQRKFFCHGPSFRGEIKASLSVEGRVVVGCCMTNQARKDWPTAFATAALLSKHYKSSFLFWAHTDSIGFDPGAYWNLHALAADYGLPSESLRITLTGQYTDSQMAAFYNACDLTILPSGGEGFGYPIAESLSCGCPCLTADYAAGAELIPDSHKEWRVPVEAFKVETRNNIARAVHSPYVWAALAEQAIELGREEGEDGRKELADSMSYLSIQNLKIVWKKWFQEGLTK